MSNGLSAAPLVNTRSSPHARLRTLPHRAVTFAPGSFWGRFIERTRTHTLLIEYEQLQRAGNIHNLQLTAGLIEGEFKGPRYMDSDLFKWMEAAAMALETAADPHLESILDDLAQIITRAQARDGYLNSYCQIVKPDERYTDLANGHELYCMGHFIQAAVAHRRATGKDALFQVAGRIVDHLHATFGHEKRDGTSGHPEIELALVEMYRESGDARCLDLAQFFINRRGYGVIGGRDYHQDHVPVRETQHVAGHAVRQLYLLAGVMDVYLETGEEAIMTMCKRVWRDLVEARLHIHGGVGSRHEGEAFGERYELPNDRTYSETCAQIASIMWNWRMLLATGDGAYANLIERTLYNGFLSGIDLRGEKFFYPNPLLSRGGIERHEWFGCACCPPNVARMFMSLGHYAATTDDAGGVQIHLYDAMSIDTGALQFDVETRYPWEGDITLRIAHAGDDQQRSIALRIPAWSEDTSFAVNRKRTEPDSFRSGYAIFRRAWKGGDEIQLRLPMPVRLTESHPHVDSAHGCVAIERGPLVYCIEQAGENESIDAFDVHIDPGGRFDERRADEVFGESPGSISVIEFLASIVERRDWKGALYRTHNPARRPRQHQQRVQAIPYFAWANRGPVAMRVWLPLSE